MSQISSQEMKLLKQAEEKARLAQKNKETARLHLLAVQAILARAPVLPRKFGT
jgi:hypothetical protein